MTTAYQKWIDARYITFEDTYGRCHAATKQMKKEFPELEIVRGYVHCHWGIRDHAWLRTPDGFIVDPTARQFPGLTKYEEWIPGSKLRIGRCMHCGQDIWREVDSLTNIPEETFCGDICADAEAREFNGLIS